MLSLKVTFSCYYHKNLLGRVNERSHLLLIILQQGDGLIILYKCGWKFVMHCSLHWLYQLFATISILNIPVLYILVRTHTSTQLAFVECVCVWGGGLNLLVQWLPEAPSWWGPMGFFFEFCVSSLGKVPR